MSGDLAFAAAAGTLAAVNPCGFAMLPAYLVLFGRADAIDGECAPSTSAALGRALQSAAVMSAGFVVVFGTFGLLLSPVTMTVQRWVPAVTVGVGALLLILGTVILAGRKASLRFPGVRIPGLASARAEGAAIPLRLMFLYGMAYAVTSLGCAIAPFLAVVATTLRAGALGPGMAAYVMYALGMGSVVGLLSVSLVLARHSAARPFRRLAPFAQAAGGILVLLVGAYVAWFGVYEIRTRSGAGAEDRVIEQAGSLQGTLARWIDALGPLGVALALVAVAMIVLVLGLRDRTRAVR